MWYIAIHVSREVRRDAPAVYLQMFPHSKDLKTLTFRSSRRIGESYGQSSDIFSLGLTILFTATGKRNEERSYWDGFKEDKFPSAEYCSDHFQSFLSSCMDTNPQRRHSANVLLGNSFLKHAELGTDKFMEVLLDQRDGDASHQYVVKST